MYNSNYRRFERSGLHLCQGIHSHWPKRNHLEMYVLSSEDRVFELQSGQTKDHEIGICCFFNKH
jgi:hypothetical protein